MSSSAKKPKAKANANAVKQASSSSSSSNLKQGNLFSFFSKKPKTAAVTTTKKIAPVACTSSPTTKAATSASASEPPSPPQPLQEWQKVSLGDRIAVYWPDDDEYYNATVTKQRSNPNANPNNGNQSNFYLEYDDGQCEWIDLAQERFRLLELPANVTNNSTSSNDTSTKTTSTRTRPSPPQAPAKQKLPAAKRRRIQSEDEEEDNDDEEAEFDMDDDDDGSAFEPNKANDEEEEEDDTGDWMVTDDDDEDSSQKAVATKKRKSLVQKKGALQVTQHKPAAAAVSRTTTPPKTASASTTLTPLKQFANNTVSPQTASSKKKSGSSSASASSSNNNNNSTMLPVPSRQISPSPTAMTPTTTTATNTNTATTKMSSNMNTNTPLMSALPYTKGAVNPRGAHVHNHLHFLRHPRDAHGRTPDEVGYDPRTLKVVHSDWEKHVGKMTDAVVQWWELKAQYFDTVLLFKTGKFYELFHNDSDIGVDVCGLSYMKGHIAHSGFPEISYGPMADKLVRAGYKVARVEQTETPDMLQERKKKNKGSNKPTPKVVNREVCSILTLGTRTFCFLDDTTGLTDDMKSSGGGGGTSGGGTGPLLAIREILKDKDDGHAAAVSQSSQDSRNDNKDDDTDMVRPVCEYGVTIIDAVRGMVTIGQFADDVLRSRMNTLLTAFCPSEVSLQCVCVRLRLFFFLVYSPKGISFCMSLFFFFFRLFSKEARMKLRPC
jgi:DNA mismatch repair protein MSH6